MCIATDKGAFNESKAERTERDEANRKMQSEHRAKFDSIVKQRTNELQRLAVIKPTVIRDIKAETVEIDDSNDLPAYNSFDESFWNEKALNDL